MRLLALGDSFTIGTGTTPERSFPAVLVGLWAADGLRCVLENPAVNGYTTDDLIREELPLIAAFTPDLVTLLIGANDIVRGGDAERYRRQLALIHARLRRDALSAKRYALPQPDWSLTRAAASFGDPREIAFTIERFNTIARDEAERSGATYVDLFPLMRDQMRRGMIADDGLHPSAEAYAEWAAALREPLRPR